MRIQQMLGFVRDELREELGFGLAHVHRYPQSQVYIHAISAAATARLMMMVVAFICPHHGSRKQTIGTNIEASAAAIAQIKVMATFRHQRL